VKGFELVRTALDDPVAQELIAALMEDLNARYGDDSSGLPLEPADFEPPVGTFLVAYCDGEAAGCGGLHRLTDGIGEIKRMFVLPEYRGRGISRSILDGLEDAGRQAGYTELWLETGLAQPEALQLYEVRGYTRIEPYGYYKDEPDVRCYAKRLEAGRS
jgi:GNAT superfamily N-acetyltransferase